MYKLLSITAISGTSFVSFTRRKRMVHPYATRTVVLACLQGSTYIPALPPVIWPLTPFLQEPLFHLAQQPQRARGASCL